jgi:hypothetical protein
MTMRLDGSVYPDIDPPDDLSTPEDKADYVQRICGAFDFGIVPEGYTLKLLAAWKDVFDRFPLKSSPAYHALRAFYGWEAVEQGPYLGTPTYIKLDRMEGREDGFEEWV